MPKGAGHHRHVRLAAPAHSGNETIKDTDHVEERQRSPYVSAGRAPRRQGLPCFLGLDHGVDPTIRRDRKLSLAGDRGVAPTLYCLRNIKTNRANCVHGRPPSMWPPCRTHPMHFDAAERRLHSTAGRHCNRFAVSPFSTREGPISAGALRRVPPAACARRAPAPTWRRRALQRRCR